MIWNKRMFPFNNTYHMEKKHLNKMVDILGKYKKNNFHFFLLLKSVKKKSFFNALNLYVLDV